MKEKGMCPIMKDKDFVWLMIVDRRGKLSAVDYTTFIRYYPSLKGIAESIAQQYN